jgi:hypothetical protein
VRMARSTPAQKPRGAASRTVNDMVIIFDYRRWTGPA